MNSPPISENEGEQSGVSFDSKSASVIDTTGKNDNAEHLLESNIDTKNLRIPEKLSNNSLQRDEDTYELEKFNKNVMIIFNHEHFLVGRSRPGTTLDVAALEDTFKQFQFDVTTHNDLTEEDLFDELERFSKMSFNDYGCICVAILTHGQDGGFLWAYDTQYSEREAFSCFDAHANSTLVAKPIIFLIQACRGRTAAARVPYGRVQTVEFDADRSENADRPTESDMIIFHSSFFGRASVRVVENGTWFIQTLCEQMKLHGSTHHLEELFLKVRQNVAAMEYHGVKQMPVVTSTLLKKLYLKRTVPDQTGGSAPDDTYNSDSAPDDTYNGDSAPDDIYNGGSTPDDTYNGVNAPDETYEEHRVSLTVRNRQYRVGLNLFNKEPERGITYLISHGFLENCPRGIARFLIKRKGLSKQMIGEYLGNLQKHFNMAVLECFANELNLSGMAVDVALRHYQAHFRLPGDALKIERLVEVFARRYCVCNTDFVQGLCIHDTAHFHLPGEAQKIERLFEALARRYCVCNTDFMQRLRQQDTIVLARAIIMLNTNLHTPNLKLKARMSLDDFVRNLRGVDDCGDIDRNMLAGIYERVKSSEFRPDSDHVTQVMKMQAMIVGTKPHLALPHRRLVCNCRLFEIPDIHKKERPGVHQREVFLFNDLLVITKIFSKKKSSVTYTFRQSFPLCGMIVNLFSVPHYPFGIVLFRRVHGAQLPKFVELATFHARNDYDRSIFVKNLRESIDEMDDMEAMRIPTEQENNILLPTAINEHIITTL